MVRRFLVCAALACAASALPMLARVDDTPQIQPPDPSSVYTLFDPDIITPECRFASNPLDCTAEAGARDIATLADGDFATEGDEEAESDLPVDAAGALAETTAAAAAVRSMERGFNTRQEVDFEGDANFGTTLDSIVATGITVHRLFVRWWDVQCANDDPTRFDFSAYVTLVKEMNARNVRAILTPVGSPNWARAKNRRTPTVAGEPCQPAPDEAGRPRLLGPFAHDDNLGAWVAFIRQLAITFQPYDIVGYEIWNEQNSRNFWDPTPTAQAPNPGAWTVRYCRAAGQIDTFDGGKPVGVGGLAVVRRDQRDPNRRIRNMKSSTFLARAYAARRSLCAAKPFDFVAYHPYAFASVVNGRIARMARTPAMLELQAVRAVMRANRQRGVKIWNTEWGFPSDVLGITRPQQAALIRQEHNFLANLKDPGANGRAFMRFSIMFNPVDGTGANVFEHMGVLTSSRTPKQPTYDTWSALP